MFQRLIRLITGKEFILYIVVGFFGTAIDFFSFFIFTHHEVKIIIAQWFAGLLGFTFTHFWHHYFVFDHDQALKKTYVLSMLVAIMSIIVSGPMLLGFEYYLESLWFSKLLVSLFLMLVIFVIRKKVIFVKKIKKIIQKHHK